MKLHKNIVLTSDAYEEHRQFWLGQVELMEQQEPVAMLYRQGELLGEDEQSIHFEFSKDAAHKIISLVKGDPTGVFVVLTSILALLQSRYTHQPLAVIQTPLLNAHLYDELFADRTAIITAVDSEATIKELLVSVRKVVSETYNFQNYPSDLAFGDREDLLNQAKTFSRSEGLHSEGEHEASELGFYWTYDRERESIACDLRFSSDFYDPVLANRIPQHLETLIKGFGNLEQPLRSLPLLETEEEQEVLALGSGVISDYPLEKSVVDLFEERAENFPDHLAIVFGDTRWTYKKLNEKANQLASFLKEDFDLHSNDCVAIILDRGDEFILSTLAVLKAGATYLPIDPGAGEDRLHFMLDQTKVKGVILQSKYLMEHSLDDRSIFAIDVQLLGLETSSENLTVKPSASDAAYIIFTSGSSGKPKGIKVGHSSLVNLCCWHAESYGVKEDSRATHFSSVGFDASVWEVWPYLLFGACVFPLEDDLRLNVPKLVGFIADNAISHVFLPSSYCEEVLEQGVPQMEHCLHMLTGGEGLRHAPLADHYRLYNNYGPTEATVVSTWVELTPEIVENEIPIGKPISNGGILLLNADGDLVPLGHQGEICVTGVPVAKEYIDPDVQSMGGFRSNPMAQGETIYRTGDWGRWRKDGLLLFEGRKDQQVKIRGFRIELEEIEKVMGTHTAVERAAVICLETNQKDKHLVGWVQSSAKIESLDLKGFLAEKLPDFMIPAEIISSEMLPLNRSGKVDRKALEAMSDKVAKRKHDIVASRNETEQQLVEIWQEVLGIEAVGVTDNFFDIGGHSLKAASVLSAIYKQMHAEIDISDLFKQPTIEAIAKLVESKDSVEYQSIPRLPVQDKYIASHAQERLWTIYQMDKASPVYNMARHFFFNGVVNKPALEKAVNAFVQRHEIVRTHFAYQQDQLFQVVLPDLDLSFDHKDLSDNPNPQAALRSVVESFTNHPFDLEEGPLLRVCLTKVNENSLLFSLVMHHIISDAISLQILIEELTQTYLAFCRNEDSVYESLPIQYKDYADWQRASMSSGSLDHHREYWHKKLGGQLPRLDLPLDLPRQASRAFKGEAFNTAIDSDLVSGIKQISQESASSTFMVLTAALHAFLYKYTGQNEHILGTPVAGRNHPDLKGQVGFYVNTIALRNNVIPDQSFSHFIERVRDSSLEAFDHQAYPFDRLVDELEPYRDFGRSALFDVLIMFLNDDMTLPDLGDLRLEEYEQAHDGTSKFDLIMVFRETPSGLNLHTESDSELFTASRIETMIGQYVRMLDQLVAKPNQRIRDHALGSEVCARLKVADCPLQNWSISADLASHAEVVVLDPDFQPLPPGISGQICLVVTDAIPEQTLNRLSSRVNPWKSEKTIIRTGESGRILKDGSFVIEQLDDQFIRFEGEIIDLFAEESSVLTLDSVEACRLRVSVESDQPTVLLVAVPSDVLGISPLQMLENIRPKVSSCFHPVLDVRVSMSLPSDQNGRMDWSAFDSKQTIPLAAIGALVQKVEERTNAVTVDASLLHQKLTVNFLTSPLREIQAPLGEASDKKKVSEPTSEALIVGDELHIPSDGPKTLVAGFLKTCENHPDNGIVHRTGGVEKWQSYATLLEQATYILGGLQSTGLKPGDKVILQVDDTALYFAAFWAALLGGIIPVTVAVPPTYARNGGVVNKLYNTWKLLDEPLLLTLRETEKAMVGLNEVFPDETWQKLCIENLLEELNSGALHEASPGDVAFYQLTSGSTGIPKCIQEKHESVIAHIWGSSQFVGYGSDDVVLNWLPMDHVVPLLMYHVKDTFLGCNQVQLPTAEVIEDPLLWLDCLETYKVTHTWSPNFGYRLVSDEIKKQPDRSWNLWGMKYFVNAGEQVTYQVVNEFLALTESFGVQPENMQPAYGMAELCTAITYVNDFDLQKDALFIQKSSLAGSVIINPKESEDTVTFMTAGRVNPGVSVRITNKQQEVLSQRQIGRVQATGSIVTKGYYQNPEANEAAFVGEGWFNTGDLGFISDGMLTITGREKDVIIINGANFYCYEIEDVVNGVDGVQSTWSAAVSRDNDELGTEELVIFFVPEEGLSTGDLLELKTSVSKSVSTSFGIAPAGIVNISTLEFPKTTSGKIQRQQLKELLLDGKYDDQLASTSSSNEKTGEVPDWFFERSWRPEQTHSSSKTTSDEVWLIFEDDQGFGASLSSSLNAQGKEVIQVKAGESYSFDSDAKLVVKPGDRDNFASLAVHLDSLPFPPTHVLWLWPLNMSTEQEKASINWRQAFSLGVYSMTMFLQSMNTLMDGSVTWGVVGQQAMKTSASQKSNYFSGGIPAWLRTLDDENEHCRCLFMNVDDLSRSTLHHVLEEMRSESVTSEVAYRNEQRLVPVLNPITFSKEQMLDSPIKQGGFYLLAGGMGGIGRQLAEHLLSKYDANILVVGRTALDEDPSREAMMDELQSMDGNIEYMQADICSLGELKQAVETMEMVWGKELNGAFHLASNASPVRNQLASPTQHITANEALETYQSQFEVKAQGMLTLADLQSDGRPFSLVAFSSVNSIFGGTLFSAYASANHMLDAISMTLNQRKGMHVKICTWSVWKGLGMSDGHPALEAAHAKGYFSLNAEQGLASMELALTCSEEQVLIGLDKNQPAIQKQMPFSLSAEQQLLIRADFEQKDRAFDMNALEKELSRYLPNNSLLLRTKEDESTADGEELTDVEAYLLEVWHDVLGNRNMRVTTNLFSLGLNSIKVVRALGKISKTHSLVNVTHLYSYPTVRQLAKFISTEPEDQTDNELSGEEFEEFQL